MTRRRVWTAAERAVAERAAGIDPLDAGIDPLDRPRPGPEPTALWFRLWVLSLVLGVPGLVTWLALASNAARSDQTVWHVAGLATAITATVCAAPLALIVAGVVLWGVVWFVGWVATGR